MGDASQKPSNTETFAIMARTLLAEADVQQTLQKIVELAVETVDGCDHAGISVVHGRTFTTPAATDDIPRDVDAIQYETNEGPCLSAIREQEVFQTGDLASEQRWPQFAHRAQRETGIASMLSFRLFVEADILGALNMYSKSPDAFDDQARSVGSVFAAHAAVALSSALHDEQMDEALASRDIIGQAKGIIMAREGVNADQAFDMLRRASQRLNVKLRKLAEDIARTGTAPGPGEPPPAGSAPAVGGEDGGAGD